MDLVPEEAMRAACDAYDAAVQVEYDAAERGELRDDAPMEEHAEVKAVLAAAPLILAAELDQLADEADRTERAVRSFGVTDYSEGKADGVNWAATALRGRASVLRGEGDRT